MKTETKPRLRFPEFQNAGEWEETTLGDAATFYNGRAYKQEELLESGKYTVLRVGNFFTSKNWYYSDLELDETKYCDNGDLLYAWSASFGPRVWRGEKTIYHYHIWKVVENPGIDRQFLFITLENETEKMKAESANGLGIMHITKGTIEGWKTTFPAKIEQQRIADCLTSLDDLMAAQARKVAALKTHKKGLMQQLFPREGETQPRLRFPEFQNAGEWEESTVEEIIATVTPPKKLQTADYGSEGEFPIIDQSQDAICGWTDDRDALISEGLPVIVFGDHTCALKYIDHPFVQGADGIKIFRPKRGIDARFLFCALEANPVVQETYKRHFSMLKEKKLSLPDPKTREQQRIADCLSSLDALITAETQKHEALKTHKRGLMQQLFPSPEEVVA